jgi:hypothetical protein
MAGWFAGRQLRAFLDSHNHTSQVQGELLAELLAAHADTAFGNAHNFGRIRNYHDFTAAVPVCTYEYYRPYIQRVLHGETSALLPADQKVLMFSMTSGTTGEPKHIPVTSRFLDDIRRGWNTFGVNVLKQHPKAWIRPIVQISSSMNEVTSPKGLPCGAISGLLAGTQKRIVRMMYIVPQWVTDILDPTARFYTILRYSIEHDVAFITTANPSSTIKLIEVGQAHTERLIRDIADGTYTPPPDGKPPVGREGTFKPNPALAKRLDEAVARDGVLLPKHFWKLSFLTNWTGGSLGLYVRHLRKLFPGVPIHDIGLLASEGRFSIPLQRDTPAGVAEITSNFLEFIPAEDRRKDNPPTLRVHELDEGAEYFLVFSNWTGLFRYNLDDRIRVVGHMGHSPIFEFLSRGLYTANITGEKITEHQVVHAMERARQQTGVAVERFVMQGRFAATPYYELRLEGLAPAEAKALAEAMDRALVEINIEYESKRKSHRLESIQPVILADGTMERAEQDEILRRHGRSEQYKHQYLLTEVLDNGYSHQTGTFNGSAIKPPKPEEFLF